MESLRRIKIFEMLTTGIGLCHHNVWNDDTEV